MKLADFILWSLVSLLLIIITALICIHYCSQGNKSCHNDTIQEEKLYYTVTDTISTYNVMYDSCIQHLKDHEGYRGHYYFDPAGYLTIGYGHKITSEDTFTFMDSSQAEQLLIQDFNKKLYEVQRYTGLNGNKLLSMGLFSFNLGFGRFKSMWERCNGRPERSILQYCHYYTRDSSYISSESLKERRRFELKLWNND